MSRSPSRTLKLTYLGDASQLARSTREAGDNVSTMGDRVRNTGRNIGIAFAAVGAAGLVMGRSLFRTFEEVSTANARVEQVVKSMGNFEGQLEGTTKRIIEQAEATARLTGVDRNLIKESQALLLTFDSVNKTAGEAGGVFDRATQAAVDLAAAGFGSATSNAQSLGRALEDPIAGLTSLTRQGVTFTEEQRELIRTLVEGNRTFEAQDIILQAIERQVGGVAEATSNGSDRMGQSFGILRDRIAEALAPAFETLVDVGGRFIDRVAAWWDRNGENIIETFRRFGERVGDAVEATREFFRGIRDARDEDLLADAAKSADELTESLKKFFTEMLKAAGAGDDFVLSLQNVLIWIDKTQQEGMVRWNRIGQPILDAMVDSFTELFEITTLLRNQEISLGELFGRSPAGQIWDNLFGSGRSPQEVGGPAGAIRPASVTNINVIDPFDPEGQARRIVRVVNDQQLRGTATLDAAGNIR